MDHLAILCGHPVGSASFLIWSGATSPSPPSPSDVKVLEQFGHIPDEVVSSIRLGSAVNDGPLVDEEWHIVLVSEFNSKIDKVVSVPLIVESLHQVSIAIGTGL